MSLNILCISWGTTGNLSPVLTAARQLNRAGHQPRVMADPTDLDARGQMLIAASMAGQLVSLTFSGVAHAVAHALGLGWDVHHGTANAVTLAWSIRFNAPHPPSAARYAR